MDTLLDFGFTREQAEAAVAVCNFALISCSLSKFVQCQACGTDIPNCLDFIERQNAQPTASAAPANSQKPANTVTWSNNTAAASTIDHDTAMPPLEPTSNTDAALDSDLAAAIKQSLAEGTNQAQQQTDQHAVVHGPLNQGQQQPLSTSTAVVLRKPSISEDNDMQRALEASLSSSMTLEPLLPDNQHWSAALSPMDHLRSMEPGSPVILRISSQNLAFLPVLLQSLYAMNHFRECLLSLPLEQRSHPTTTGPRFSYSNYWRGDVVWEAGSANLSDPEAHLSILRALQRLFALIKYTRRSTIDVQDVANALRLEPQQHMLTDPASASHSAVRRIVDAWTNGIVTLSERALLTSEEASASDMLKSRQTIFATKGIGYSHRDNVSEAGEVSSIPFNSNNKPDQDMYTGFDSTFASDFASESQNLNYLSDPAKDLVVLVGRQVVEDLESFGSIQDRKPLYINEQLHLDRYTIERRQDIYTLRTEERSLIADMSSLEARKKAIGTRDVSPA